MLTKSLSLSLAAGLTAAASAQTPLVETGDTVTGVGVVTRIDDVAINSNGSWVIEVDTDNADTSMDLAILENGVLKFQEGTDINLTGATDAVTLSSGDRMFVTDNGEGVYLLRCRTVSGNASRNLVIWNDIILMEEDITPFNAPGAPAGAIWDSIAEIWVNSNRQALVGGRLDNGDDVAAKIEFDAMGNITSEEILAMDGQTLTAPGHNAPIQGFSFSRQRNNINANGDVIWFVDDESFTMGGTVSNTCCDSFWYRNNAPLLQEGTPSPVMNNVIGSLSSGEVDQNDNGDWIAQIAQNPSTFNMDMILLNGTTVLAAEGQTLPGIPGGAPLDGLGATTGVFLGNNGNTVFHSTWDIPDTTMDGGIFLNGELFIHEGVSTVNGVVIERIQTSDNTIDVSDSGQLMVVELRLADGTEGAYLYQLSQEVGTTFCTSLPNSTGVNGTLVGSGTDLASGNDLTLTAGNLPVGQFGIFVVSPTAGNMPVGQGIICLAGQIGRYNQPGQVLQVDANGEFSLALDLTMTPTPNAFVAVMSGDTYYFQAWHRDGNVVNPQSNFTDGLQVDFQ